MKIITTFLLAAVLVGCESGQPVDHQTPVRPADVPTHTCDGTPIEWTWPKQQAYNEGRLFFERDSTGCVIFVVRKMYNSKKD